MVVRYGRIYRNKGQFVFQELAWDYEASLWALLGGLCFGFLFSVLLVLLDGVLLSASFLFLSLVGWLSVKVLLLTIHSDPAGCVIFVVALVSILAFFYALQEQVVGLWGRAGWPLVLFYTTIAGTGAPLAYFYAQLACVEDKRKHQLILLQSRPDTPPSAGDMRLFVVWILSILSDLFTFSPSSAFSFFPTEAPNTNPPSPGVTIRNETLKRVKVCLYHAADFCCWIPSGGIAGPSVALIDAGDETTISLHTPLVTAGFKLKIFSPGLIDRELGFEPHAKPGDLYLFTDVQRKIVLNSTSDDSSADENVTPSVALEKSASTTLTRNRVSFNSLHSSPQTPSLVARPALRKPSSGEIEVRNDSSEAVRASFYSETSVSFLFPLSQRQLRGERDIPVGVTRRFTGASEKFCMRVRSAEFGAEIDFCTVQTGNRYAITDGLID